VNKRLHFRADLEPIRQTNIAKLVRHALAEICTVPVLLVFSEREAHVGYMLSPVRLSSVCRLQRSCALLRRFRFSAIFLRR